jgi:predicted phosphoribosyltransferase
VRFQDRREAGRRLAQALESFRGRHDLIVLALPRGGVPVAFEVAEALAAPLDVFVVRKIGLPGYEELAMGAVASGGVIAFNREVIAEAGLPPDELRVLVEGEAQEVATREARYREGRPPLDVVGLTVLVVDDGLATGSTMLAAILALRQLKPARVVVAVPVAPAEVCASIATRADEVVCLDTPDPFFAVGAFYHDFSQTSDAEVKALLLAADRSARPGAAPP